MSAPTPILFGVLNEMARLLSLIREGGDAGAGTAGYYFDWNPSQMFDTVLMKAGPNASLYYQGEVPQDEEQGNNGGLYDNYADISIEVQFLYDSEPENPTLVGQRDILKCQEDLKRFIEHHAEALRAIGLFDIWRPKDIRSEVKYSQDKTNPVSLTMPWRIQYSQSRKEPELPG